MKRKKIKLGLAILSILTVISISSTSFGSIINKGLEDEQLTTLTIEDLKVGEINIYTMDHKTCDNPVVEVKAFDKSDIDPGEVFMRYNLYVEYYIECPGDADHAWVDMTCKGDTASANWGKGGINKPSESPLEGRLELPISIYPKSTPQTIPVRIHALYKDGVTDIWPGEEILGDVTKTANLITKNIEPKFYCSVSNGGTFKLQGEIKDSTFKDFSVKNTGMEFSELTYSIDTSNINTKYIEEVSPTSGTLKKGSISKNKIQVNTKALPRREKTNLDGGYLLIDVTGDNDYSIQDYRVNIKIDVVHKKAKTMHNDLYFLIQERFPYLFALLQELSMF
jgi:hypothetical protein